MPNYLPGMLEVPWIEGQSECPCGNDDRYYAFGLWTDYCGMSMKELKKYNSYCGENCEGGGGGGGCKPCPCPPCPDPPEPPVPPTPEKIIDVIKAVVSGSTITFTPHYVPTSDLVLTVKYQYTDINGNLVKTEVTTVLEAGTAGTSIKITIPGGATGLSVLDILVSPDEDENYKYVIEREDKDVTVKDAFRFDFVSHQAEDSELLTPDYVATLIPAYFRSKDYVELEFSLGEPEVESTREFKTYRDLIDVPGLNNMDDDEAEAAIVANSVDIILAVDTDIRSWKIVDELGLPFETPGYTFEKIGTVIYDEENYNILRYRNPDNLSLATDPEHDPISNTFAIKFYKNQ